MFSYVPPFETLDKHCGIHRNRERERERDGETRQKPKRYIIIIITIQRQAQRQQIQLIWHAARAPKKKIPFALAATPYIYIDIYQHRAAIIIECERDVKNGIEIEMGITWSCLLGLGSRV